jgi:hypothetical protein
MSAAFICASAGPVESMACAAFKSVEVEQVRTVAQAYGGYQISDAQCDLLQRKGLVLHVVGYSSVLGGSAIGWAEVRLQDATIGAISGQAGLSTSVNSANGTRDFADQLLLAAIKDAITRLNFEIAAAQIDSYREKAFGTSSPLGGKRVPKAQ